MAWKPSSSVAPWATPPLMPPPAIQMEKAKGWWSRPSEPCEPGVRPNSVAKITIVSASRPRRSRSVRKSGRWIPCAVSCRAAPQLRQKIPTGGVMSARARPTKPENAAGETVIGDGMMSYHSDMTVYLK